ncbi:MAG: DUF3298 and DUF4163 domain-containing protein [bacterium]|nr:DUF3298 and DUF4163 domain-containing protein [bacterium]
MNRSVFIIILAFATILSCEFPKKKGEETPSSGKDNSEISNDSKNDQAAKNSDSSDGTTTIKDEVKKEESEEISYSEASINKSFGNCADESKPCAKVVVTYPSYDGSNSKFVNKQINKRIATVLADYLPDTKVRTSDPDKVADMILADYEKFIKEYNDVSEKWNINVEAEISHINGNILSIAVQEKSYTGGAHGNTKLTYINYNWNSKKELSGKDLVTNWSKLTKVAEKYFRKSKGYSDRDDLGEKGYFFENGKFELTKNIGLTKQGLNVYFNSYEIAPYVMGPSSITIPYSEISDILKD